MKRLASVLFVSLAVTGGTAEARSTSRHAHRIVPRSAQPDQVIQWNQELLQLLQVPGTQPATVHPTRTMAITQLAEYDAVNAIVGGHEPYLFQPRAPRGASPDAAAAAAAHAVLVALLPSQQQAIDAKFQDSLAQIGAGPRAPASRLSTRTPGR